MKIVLKGLKILFLFIYAVGVFGNALFFLYVEWLFIRANILQIFNPQLQFKVLFFILNTRLFWILVGITVAGAAFGALFSKYEEM